ncbi:MAG: hypothetical protein AB7F61_11005 [Desulfobulbus sp.]
MRDSIVPMITMARIAITIFLFVSGMVWASDGRACSADSDCNFGEFCDTTPKCPGDGVTGVCATKPLACTMDYDPVTACDLQIYSNACMAASNGQSIEGSEEQRIRHQGRSEEMREQQNNQ